jgi:hypothetical protein
MRQDAPCAAQFSDLYIDVRSFMSHEMNCLVVDV